MTGFGVGGSLPVVGSVERNGGLLDPLVPSSVHRRKFERSTFKSTPPAGGAPPSLSPEVYSLVGDWFPARKRASATAMVTAASGAGVFAGQVC